MTIHPSDVAIAGSKQAVARARAAVADRLTKTAAYLTASEEAQEVEDALRALRDPDDPDQALTTLGSIDERLAELTVPYEEWEVLYRQRLQVERDLLRTGQVPADQGDAEEEQGTVGRLARAVKELIR